MRRVLVALALAALVMLAAWRWFWPGSFSRWAEDVLTIRNLFPDRIAMRLDEPEQVDMVLGDGARDRGAACELIPADPATGAGVAFVRLESDPDPVRVRAGWVTDADIRALADACIPDHVEWQEVAA
jgi:DNA segregation ATPase FtsK/SpoIIIE, S-DNA-T family